MKNIVYYGPFNERVTAELSNEGLGFVSLQNPGSLQYRSALDAIQRFPSFNGYLFIHDDFLVDINSLFSWNLSTLWRSEYTKVVLPDFNDESIKKGWWWDDDVGLPAVMNVLSHSNYIYDAIVSCIGGNDTYYIGAASSDFLVGYFCVPLIVRCPLMFRRILVIIVYLLVTSVI